MRTTFNDRVGGVVIEVASASHERGCRVYPSYSGDDEKDLLLLRESLGGGSFDCGRL